MSTILSALRRLEEDKAAAATAQLQESVIAPALPAARPRRVWWMVVAAFLAAGLGAAVAWQFAPGSGDSSPALAQAGTAVRAPDPISLPQPSERRGPPPVAAAPPAREAMRAAPPLQTPAPQRVARGQRASNPVPSAELEDRDFSSDVVVTRREPRPSLLAESVSAPRPTPEEAFNARAEAPTRIVRPASQRPKISPAVVVPPAEAVERVDQTARIPEARRALPDAAPVASASEPERVAVRAERVGSASPRRDSPPPPTKLERVGRAIEPAREAGAQSVALRSVVEPAPVPRVTPAPRPPSVSAGKVPQLVVTRTTWHPEPDRRRAQIRLNGSSDAMDLAEGDRVGDLVLMRIKPSGVVFEFQGVEMTRGVGASN